MWGEMGEQIDGGWVGGLMRKRWGVGSWWMVGWIGEWMAVWIDG